MMSLFNFLFSAKVLLKKKKSSLGWTFKGQPRQKLELKKKKKDRKRKKYIFVIFKLYFYYFLLFFLLSCNKQAQNERDRKIVSRLGMF